MTLTVSAQSYSQEYEIMKRRTISSSICALRSNGEWTNWTEATPLDALIVIDFNISRIKVYTKTTQVYDIVNYSVGEANSTSFSCVDSDGKECDLLFTSGSVVIHYPTYIIGYITYHL